MNKLISRRRKLKQKFSKREKIFAAWSSLAHPSITEMFCKAPFDFVVADLEHTTISQEECQRIIAAAQAEEALCLPRIASHNMEMIKRVLDSGADGIIVPMIETEEQAERIVEFAKYPPLGKRSYGVSRAHGYGFDFDQNTKTWNSSSTILVQIESIKGVENIESILSCKEIDGVMVGPYDLSGSLNIPGQLDHPLVKKAEKKIIDACGKYHKPCGTHIVEANRKNTISAFSTGYTFAVLSSDIFVLWKWGESVTDLMSQLKL